MQRCTGELRHSINPVQGFELLEVRITCFLYSSSVHGCKEVKSSPKERMSLSPVVQIHCQSNIFVAEGCYSLLCCELISVQTTKVHNHVH